MEMIGSLILLAAGVSIVAQRGTITTGNAGLSIAFALQVREIRNKGESYDSANDHFLCSETTHQTR